MCTAPVWNAPKTDSTLRPKPVYPFPERRVHIVYHTREQRLFPILPRTQWRSEMWIFCFWENRSYQTKSKRFSVFGRFTHKIYFEPNTFRRVVRQKNRNVCALNRPCSMFAWISSTDRIHFPSKRRRSKYDFVWKPLVRRTSVRPVQIDDFPQTFSKRPQRNAAVWDRSVGPVHVDGSETKCFCDNTLYNVVRDYCGPSSIVFQSYTAYSATRPTGIPVRKSFGDSPNQQNKKRSSCRVHAPLPCPITIRSCVLIILVMTIICKYRYSNVLSRKHRYY